MYDPVKCSLSNVQVENTAFWPAFGSSSNNLPELREELVRKEKTSSAGFELKILHNNKWLDEETFSTLVPGDLPEELYVMAVPRAPRFSWLPDFSTYHRALQEFVSCLNVVGNDIAALIAFGVTLAGPALDEKKKS